MEVTRKRHSRPRMSAPQKDDSLYAIHKVIVILFHSGSGKFLVLKDRREGDPTFITGGCYPCEVRSPHAAAVREMNEEVLDELRRQRLVRRVECLNPREPITLDIMSQPDRKRNQTVALRTLYSAFIFDLELMPDRHSGDIVEAIGEAARRDPGLECTGAELCTFAQLRRMCRPEEPDPNKRLWEPCASLLRDHWPRVAAAVADTGRRART